MSNNLDLDQVAANQNQKEATINDANGELDAAITERLEVDVTSGNQTVTADDYRRAIYIDVVGATVAGRTVTLQAIKRLIVVSSSEDATQSIDIILGTTTETIPATEKFLIYTDGTANGLFIISGGGGGGGVTAFTALTDTPGSYASQALLGLRVNAGETAIEFGDASAPYDVGGAFGGVPPVTTVILQFLFTRTVVFPSGMTLSQGKAGTAATAQTDFDLQNNGSSFGTMRFAATATTSTFISASGSTFNAGDELRIVSPNPADATLADLVFTLAGRR